MTLDDTLYLGTGVFLAAYALLCVHAFKVSRSPAMLIVLTLSAYWSLVGALSILPSKRVAGGSTFSYLEDRLFLILVDDDYARTLLSYAVFLALVVGVFTVLAKPAAKDPGALASWREQSVRFAHPVLLAAVGAMTAVKVLIVARLVAASGGASLYTATRTVQGSLSGELRIYQYLNVTSSYALAAGLALWLGFVAGRTRYRSWVRWLLWAAYGAFLVEVMGENALLGNRAVPLVVMGAVATGWLRWRFLPSSARERRPQAARFVLIAAGGLMLLGAIGASRGGDLSSPAAVAQALATSATHPGAVLEQVAGSSEKIASHMSLYGVIQQDGAPREALAANSYQAYATLVEAPADQVFTVHYVAAWWLRLGPVGVPVAGLSFGIVMALLQRLALAAHGTVRSAFALPAAVLPAAALPVIVLRSGPDSERAVVVELVLLPGIVCFAACWAGLRARRPTTSSPHTSPFDQSPTTGQRPTGARAMNPHETSDVTRGLDALRRWWWIPVLAVVAGAVLGFATGGDDETATFETVVSTPVVDLSVLGGVNPTPPVDALASELQSPTTVDSLGEAVDGVAVATTVALDKSSVSVRGTAADPETARRGTEAYARAMADLYQEYVAAQAARVQKSLDVGIAALDGTTDRLDPNGPENASTLAQLQVRRQAVTSLADSAVETSDLREISSSGGGRAATALLALAFGALATGIVALSGLSARRLRYRDDIERVTGRDTLLSEVTGGVRAGGTSQVLDRLAGSGPITLIPVGDRPIDDLRTELVGASVADVVLGAPLVGTDQAPSTTGPAVLVVRLGEDTVSDLDLAHREFSAAGGTFAGVVAIAPRAGRGR